VFESGWTFDHLYPLMGDSTEDCLEGWITLTALLQETRRLRGGVLVTGMVYRHPGVLANMASTLDITSGGRLELGIGAGWNEEECDAFGIELGSMKERFDRFEEGLAVLESLLSNERTTFKGEYYELTEAMNNPKPVQRPLPVCIGGKGKKAHAAVGGALRNPLELHQHRRRRLCRVSRGLAPVLRSDRSRPQRDHLQHDHAFRRRHRRTAT
jgi:alkanesulfonate monooxygenase SsuD/methylene tetrahydromethanopterin reductase-like flavin-dependent oxidoreductase (luciferase family)